MVRAIDTISPRDNICEAYQDKWLHWADLTKQQQKEILTAVVIVVALIFATVISIGAGVALGLVVAPVGIVLAIKGGVIFGVFAILCIQLLYQKIREHMYSEDGWDNNQGVWTRRDILPLIEASESAQQG